MSSLPQVKTFQWLLLHGAASGDVIVASIYLPGSAVATPTLFAELTTFHEALETYRCPVVLLGDLNDYLEKIGSAEADELKDLLASFDMC